jgi:7-cyano-7-deazaguanine synthase
MKSAILMSGGMDSAALAVWKRPAIAITVSYGQICAQGELDAAKEICRVLGLPHHLVNVDCRHLGSGDLAGAAPDVRAPSSEWWPFRNQLLVTLAAMKAIALGVNEIMLGTVKTDGTHRDGTPEFYAHVDALLRSQEGELRVTAPAIQMTTAELVRTSGIDPSVLAWCHSCHASNVACGKCRGCLKHRTVLAELGHEVY